MKVHQQPYQQPEGNPREKKRIFDYIKGRRRSKFEELGLDSKIATKQFSSFEEKRRPKTVEFALPENSDKSRNFPKTDAATGQKLIFNSENPFKEKFRLGPSADVFERDQRFLAETSNPIYTVYSLTSEKLEYKVIEPQPD